MSEFAFELALCAALEERTDGVVSRQLGAGVADPGGRILDVAVVEPGPEFADRVALAAETIPDAAIEADVGPGRFRHWADAFDCHRERATEATERAVELGFFERERRRGRTHVRQVDRYPDWVGSIVGIENKPDLSSPGALERQLRTDASLGLVDRAVLATRSRVTGAHLNRIPDAVGVWRLHGEPAIRPPGGAITSKTEGDTNSKAISNSKVTTNSKATTRSEVSTISNVPSEFEALEIEVVREPATLPVDAPGIEPLAFEPGRTEVAVVSAAAKARARRRLAERAYGKGWRTFAFPACAACEPTAAPTVAGTRAETASGGRTFPDEGGCASPNEGEPASPNEGEPTSPDVGQRAPPDEDGDGGPESAGATLPHCAWKGRPVDAERECGPACPGHEPAEAPTVDPAAEREARTPWVADPPGLDRRQSGLDRFG